MPPRSFTKEDGLHPEDLFHSAHDHASAARMLAASSASHLDSAGYLAHIAVELALKAWLLFGTGKFDGVHSLHRLYEQLQEELGAPNLSDPFQKLLSTFDGYAELRYPNRNAPTEVGSADLGELTALIDFIYSCYPPELRSSISGLDPTQKGGRVLMKKRIEEE